MPSSCPIFRVSFTGSVLESSVLKAVLDGVERRWEGSESDLQRRAAHHRALVGANTEQEAIETVREALASHGAFGDFHAALVRDSRGEVMLTPIRSWTDIDWEEVQRNAPLTELQRNVLLALLNDHEPTSIVAGDAARVRRANRSAEAHADPLREHLQQGASLQHQHRGSGATPERLDVEL
jgi:hypothetical protein